MENQLTRPALTVDSSDVRHRFNISAHLRDAEREIDEIHGKWLLCQKACSELTRLVEDLRALNKEGLDIIEGLRNPKAKPVDDVQAEECKKEWPKAKAK